MLRDIAESRRVTRGVQRHFDDPESKVLDATIVSRLCWPLLTSEAFEPPPVMAREMCARTARHRARACCTLSCVYAPPHPCCLHAVHRARFEKQFMHAKAPRKLVWKPALGCVTLDVTFADKTVKGVKCTPIHATILVTFGEQPKWTLSALAAKLKLEADALKRRMALWVNRGFIHEVSRSADGEIHYEAPTHLGAGAEGRPHAGDEEEDGGGGGGAAEAQLEQEMRVYEQYVTGMLTSACRRQPSVRLAACRVLRACYARATRALQAAAHALLTNTYGSCSHRLACSVPADLGQLPVGRIHNMLRMFLPQTGDDPGFDKSEAELGRFLNRLVEDGKLENVAGQYRIRPAS